MKKRLQHKLRQRKKKESVWKRRKPSVFVLKRRPLPKPRLRKKSESVLKKRPQRKKDYVSSRRRLRQQRPKRNWPSMNQSL